MIGLVSGGGHIGKPAYVDSWLCLTQIQSEEELQAKGNHPTSKIHFASFLPELQRRSLKILEEPVSIVHYIRSESSIKWSNLNI